MTPFGVEHTRISKGSTKLALKMVGGRTSRAAMTGGVKRTGELSRRMAAGKAAGKPTPHGAFSQTQLGRIKTDPLG